MIKTNLLSSNVLKLLACLSMAIDHIGFLLFPNVIIFRIIGRLAMPIFAFFIAEGCRKTSDIKLYFLRILGLGIVCQLFYLANDLLASGIRSVYLNILITLSLSVLLCFAYLKLEDSIKAKNTNAIFNGAVLFSAVIIFIVLLLIFCENSEKMVGIKITIDYSFGGIVLPFFALIFEDKLKKLLLFTLGIGVYCFGYMGIMPYIWYSFLALPILILYSGKRGKHKLKYFFYAFYPLHLGLIYLIKILFF